MGKRQGIQLAYPYTDKRMGKWFTSVDHVYLQSKLNGERMKWVDGKMLSSEANEFISIPHIEDELNRIFPKIPLDGELYVHGMRRQDIHSIVSRKRNLHEHYDQMEFHVFDLPIVLRQADRFEILYGDAFFAKLKVCEYIKPVDLYEVHNTLAIHNRTKMLVEDGYEGSILRYPDGYYTPKRSIFMVKYKPGGRDKYKLVACHEGEGKYAGTLGAMTVVDPEGNQFNVGSFAVPDGERDRLWKNRNDLLGRSVQVRYTELTERGVPPSGVYELTVK